MQHSYKHLDKDDKFTIEMDMKQVVKNVNSINYGVHRFISELIDIRRSSEFEQHRKFADELEGLLNKGYF